MKLMKTQWVVILLFVFAVLVLPPVAMLAYAGISGETAKDNPWSKIKAHRTHLDHTPFFKDVKLSDGPSVTAVCLRCHRKEADHFMKTRHWLWVGDEAHPVGVTASPVGKKNLMNNFCISIENNWQKCTKCHAGYGWKDDKFDFSDPTKVDCLVCHDSSGTYGKKDFGLVDDGVDLLAVAKSVSWPRNTNCGYCHSYGGGGLGVKHGDLDASLNNPTSRVDAHMGKHGLGCIDCHSGTRHEIIGNSMSVSMEVDKEAGCVSCHKATPHADDRLNRHLSAVACQTCHIPEVAIKVPTKTEWYWSEAGKDEKEDLHHYMKIKGRFEYKKNLQPEYLWFDGQVNRYLRGDKIDPQSVTHFNLPMGGITDPKAKIWPFKIHRGNQIYDSKNMYLMEPVTAGEGGYWRNFDWNLALVTAAAKDGLPYSGSYDFAPTDMHWPLSHMVAIKEKALTCVDCHGEKGRLNWAALGYYADPKLGGSRKSIVASGSDDREKP